MNRPAISVIIPTYNRAEFLPRALDSVIVQTYRDWEIIVVDDGSTDTTPRILDSYRARLGDRLIHVRQENSGCSAARNRGIELSRGAFIAFLDSDDEFLPQKLERQVGLLALRPSVDFVYSDYSFIDLEGVRCDSALSAKFPSAREVPLQHVAPGLYEAGPELFDALLRGYFIATIVGLVRREVLGAAIRFNAGLSYAEEWLFYLTLSRSFRAGFVDEPLALHHYTANSLTRSDKLRNLKRQCELFKVMHSTFPELSRYQRSLIDGHLARAHGQLATHLRRTGQLAQGLLCSAKAFRYRLLSL